MPVEEVSVVRSQSLKDSLVDVASRANYSQRLAQVAGRSLDGTLLLIQNQLVR